MRTLCWFKRVFAPSSKRDFQRHLYLARVVLLCLLHASKTAAGRIRVRRQEARMVEGVKRLEPVLDFDLLADCEILIDSRIQIVDIAGAHVAPTRRNRPDVVAEIRYTPLREASLVDVGCQL